MRYRGQSYEVAVDVPMLVSAADLDTLAQRFHDAHRRRYGHMAEGEAVEIVNFQVTGVGAIPRPPAQKFSFGDGSRPRPAAQRPAHFAGAAPVPAPVFRRAALAPGATIEGPAIIEEKTSTIVLYPGQTAQVDEYLNVEIALPEASP